MPRARTRALIALAVAGVLTAGAVPISAQADSTAISVTYSGTFTVGSTVTAVIHGLPADASFEDMTWSERHGDPYFHTIASDTLSYKIKKSDKGGTLLFQFDAYEPMGGADFYGVAKSHVVKGALKSLHTHKPTISGKARAGKTLTAHAGAWGPGKVTLRYQWKADGVAIPKATKSKWKAKALYAGRKITVTVTGSRSGYATTAKTSKGKSLAGDVR